MVSIPVRLHKAARRERIRFHNVYRPPPAEMAPEPEEEAPLRPVAVPRGKVQELPPPAPPAAAGSSPVESVARVRNLPVAETTEAPIERSRVMKGYEIEKDRYVTFEPDEIAALRPETSTELAIAEFVRLQEIDPIFFETSYYAAPDRGGEKPYALLFRALTETGYAAIGSLAMHGREHATIIRAGKHGLIVHSLFYQNEVRASEEHHTDPALSAAKELELAKTLIHALAVPFDPAKLKDVFEERLRERIEARSAEAVESYAPVQPEKAAPAADILAALRKSIEMARKPPVREKAATRSAAEAPKPRQRRSRS